MNPKINSCKAKVKKAGEPEVQSLSACRLDLSSHLSIKRPFVCLCHHLSNTLESHGLQTGLTQGHMTVRFTG